MKKDFIATIATGMHPFMVSYGFEEFARLAGKIGIPDEVISRSPADFHARVYHALDIDCA